MRISLPATFYALILLLSVLTIPSTLADSWYPGKGLKQGDYFRYSVCWADWHNCSPIEIEFWVKNQTSDGTSWTLEFLAIDGSMVQRGNVTIGTAIPSPMHFDSHISDYTNIYNNTIVWLDSFTTKNTPKDFNDTTWGNVPVHCSQSIGPLGHDTVTVHAGTFDTWKIGWYGNPADSTIWVAPNLPFPVKATIYVPCLGMLGALNWFNFELLETGNSQTPPLQFFYTYPLTWEHPSAPSPATLSPLKQIQSGIRSLDVKCNTLQLVIKLEDGSPACVTPKTAQKLVERGWAMLVNLNTQQNPPILSESIKPNSSKLIINPTYSVSHFEPSSSQARSTILFSPQPFSEVYGSPGTTVTVTLTLTHIAGKDPLPQVTLIPKGVSCCFISQSLGTVDLNKLVTFSDSEIILKPGNTKQITLHIAIPQNWSAMLDNTITFPLEFGNKENYQFPDLFFSPTAVLVHVK